MTRKRRMGQALTEFALVVPIFVIIIFAIIDFGRYAFTANALSNAAREGARVGSVGNRPTECAGLGRQACIERVAADRSWGVANGQVATTVTCERVSGSSPTPISVSVASCRTDDLLKVRSQTTFVVLTPLIGQFIGNLTVSGESRVTVNQ